MDTYETIIASVRIMLDVMGAKLTEAVKSVTAYKIKAGDVQITKHLDVIAWPAVLGKVELFAEAVRALPLPEAKPCSKCGLTPPVDAIVVDVAKSKQATALAQKVAGLEGMTVAVGVGFDRLLADTAKERSGKSPSAPMLFCQVKGAWNGSVTLDGGKHRPVTVEAVKVDGQAVWRGVSPATIRKVARPLSDVSGFARSVRDTVRGKPTVQTSGKHTGEVQAQNGRIFFWRGNDRAQTIKAVVETANGKHAQNCDC